ncbi:MAG: DUF2027 domain-containing protein, partial [Parachlamydiaceae bacterium]
MNEVGGGRVTAILSKEMVSVETQDGFEIPTYIKNLVVVPSASPSTALRDRQTGGQSHASTLVSSQLSSSQNPSSQYPEVKSSGFKEVNQKKGGDLPEFIFAALPSNPGNPPDGQIQLYLVNDCNFTVIYHFAIRMGDRYTTIDAGMLEPNTKVELDSIQPKGIGELPEYCFQLLFFRKSGTQLEEPVQKEVKISPVRFFKASSFVKNEYFASPALLIRLADHPLKAELEKLSEKDFQTVTLSKETKKTVAVLPPKSDLMEVDLHVHELIDDIRGLTNADMLKLQLDAFRKEMETAI